MKAKNQKIRGADGDNSRAKERRIQGGVLRTILSEEWTIAQRMRSNSLSKESRMRKRTRYSYPLQRQEAASQAKHPKQQPMVERSYKCFRCSGKRNRTNVEREMMEAD